MYAGMVDGKGNLQLYDGGLRFRSANGEVVEDHIPADDYAQWIGEASLRESYLKAPYFKPLGFPSGVYR
jgi:NAD-reducing hydrogenase large subunit